jgi:hypothetical protein
VLRDLPTQKRHAALQLVEAVDAILNADPAVEADPLQLAEVQ